MTTIKRWMLGLLGATLLATGTQGVATAKPSHRAKHQAKIAKDVARATALAQVPGTVKAEELEREGGRWIYSFEIRPTGETRHLIKEVNIDADTGELVGKIDTEKD